MYTLDIIFTTLNVCLAIFSFCCALFSAYHTKKQTDIMQKQLEHDLEPDFALTTHLDGIKNSIYSVRDCINNTHNK